MSHPKPRGQQWAPNPNSASIVVPGVDTDASVNDQIDQIDQLITIRLQNIDANFSRIQTLIANKLLPAFKKYAESTEPVRDAAKFWKSFYEAAAQVQIPVYSDISSLYEDQEESEEQESTVQVEDEQTPVNPTPPEDSFAHGAAVSSTPLVRDPSKVVSPNEDESWAASIESPFERLGRQMKDLTMEENVDYPSTSSAPSFSPLHGSYTGTLPNFKQEPSGLTAIPMPKSQKKGKTPLRDDLLRQNAAMSFSTEDPLTPRAKKFTPRHKTPKNPFIPPYSSSRKWNGIVDLRQSSPARPQTAATPGASTGYESDSSDDIIPPGMSPPVTMQFAIPNRYRTSPVKLNPTPVKKAAERIGSSLVASMASGVRGTSQRMHILNEESQSSIAPSVPSFTRYAEISSTLSSGSIISASQLSKQGELAQQTYRSRADPQLPAHPLGSQSSYNLEEARQHPVSRLDPRLVVDEDGPRSPTDSDTDSSEHGESNPSAAFIFATQNNARSADDSFGSSEHSFSSDEDEAARVARHPLAHVFIAGDQGADDSDDSFAPVGGGEDEDTVFGGRQVGAVPNNQRLTLMPDTLLDDTYTGAALNPYAQVEQTPTPHVNQQSSGPLGQQ